MKQQGEEVRFIPFHSMISSFQQQAYFIFMSHVNVQNSYPPYNQGIQNLKNLKVHTRIRVLESKRCNE